MHSLTIAIRSVHSHLSIILAGLLCLASTTCIHAQALLQQVDQREMESWVESQMALLDTPEKQLGQLIMPMIYQGKGSYDTPETRTQIERQVRRYHIGGVVFSRTSINEHAVLTNHAQQQAHQEGLPPLLVAVDGEWGLAMRMNDAVRFPRNRDLGRITGPMRDTLLYLYGQEMARQCRLMGIHINFGPVLDIDSNPKNPVIGNRSYGNSANLVTSCGIYYSHGLEDGGVMACAKHFPGHGDTHQDSHKTLPRLNLKREKLEDRELKPFQTFIDQQLGGIMTAHLDLPKLAERSGMPSSASRRIVHDLLQTDMGFQGLVITDGLAMKGACDYPDVCVKALLAGNDILLQPTPDDRQWQSLLRAMDDGRLPAELIAEKCRRVLRWKYALIVHPMPVRGVRTLPYPQIDTLGLVSRVATASASQLSAELARLSQSTGDDGIDPTLQTALQQDIANMIDHPAPTAIATTPTLQAPPVPVLSLPTATPSEVGMDGARLAEVARLAQETVTSGAVPGCQVLVARHGRVVFHQTYGIMGGPAELNPYASLPVTAETMYDLASVSKALGTVPAVMMLMHEHGMKLKDRITRWIPELKGTPYAKVTLQDLLYHESGLQEGYPFYKLIAEPDSAFRAEGMLQKIVTLKPRRKQGKYLYSDLNFVLLRHIIERVSGERLDQYLTHRLPQFYGPWLGYNPLQQGVPLSAIAPTEYDQVVRHRLVHGTVHDENGAWGLGVEGNSGLFGSAQALVPLLQMMMKDGMFDGQQYLPREVCHQFTTQRSSHSRRGLGFDRPETQAGKSSPTCQECSASTWGHTGFTGTCFWVDPKEELIFIYLSNRVCPSRDNRTLMSENFRPRIQSAIYQAIRR